MLNLLSSVMEMEITLFNETLKFEFNRKSLDLGLLEY